MSTALVRVQPSSSGKSASVTCKPSTKKGKRKQVTSTKPKTASTTADISKGKTRYDTWRETDDGKKYDTLWDDVTCKMNDPDTNEIARYYGQLRWRSVYGDVSSIPDTLKTADKTLAANCRASDDYKKTLGKQLYDVEKLLKKEGNEDLRAYLARRAADQLSQMTTCQSTVSRPSLTEKEKEVVANKRGEQKRSKAQSKSERASNATSKTDRTRLPTMPTTVETEKSKSAQKRQRWQDRAGTESQSGVNTASKEEGALSRTTETEGTKRMVLMEDGRSLVEENDHFQYIRGHAETIRGLFLKKRERARAGKYVDVPISTKATIYDNDGNPDWAKIYRREDREEITEAPDQQRPKESEELTKQRKSMREMLTTDTGIDDVGETMSGALITQEAAAESQYGALLHLKAMDDASETVALKIKEAIENDKGAWSLVNGAQERSTTYFDEDTKVLSTATVRMNNKGTNTIIETKTTEPTGLTEKDFVNSCLSAPTNKDAPSNMTAMLGDISAAAFIAAPIGQRLLEYDDAADSPPQTTGMGTIPDNVRDPMTDMTKRIGFGTNNPSELFYDSSKRAIPDLSALASGYKPTMGTEGKQETWKNAMTSLASRMGKQTGSSLLPGESGGRKSLMAPPTMRTGWGRGFGDDRAASEVPKATRVQKRVYRGTKCCR